MFPVGSYDDLINRAVPQHEGLSREMPTTLGILVGDIRQAFCREYILGYAKQFDDLSGRNINIYVPGYCSEAGMQLMREKGGYDEIYKPSYNIHEKNYFFSDDFFIDFIGKLKENHGIMYEGQAELILFEVINGQIAWNKRLRLKIEQWEKKHQIDSAYKFLIEILDSAKRHVNIGDMSKEHRAKAFKKSIHDIIKNKLPESIAKINDNDELYRLENWFDGIF